MEKRQKTNEGVKFEFKARKVPDFAKVNNSIAGLKSVLAPKTLTQFAEFSLSGDNHLTSKTISQDLPVTAVFKAAPVKAKLN